MSSILLSLFALAAVIVIGKAMANRANTQLISVVQLAGGIALCTLGVLLSFGGPARMLLGMSLGALGLLLLLRRAQRGPVGQMGTAGGPQGQVSQVRTRFIDMMLDHETGEMTGAVLSGAFAGRSLDQLTAEERIDLLAELQSDPQSAQVYEAWLDRAEPDWRENWGFAGDGSADDSAQGAAGGGRRAGSGSSGPAAPTTRSAALAILGLDDGASDDDVRAAHRDLMKKLHPDQGGSTYLAMQINAAKDFLLAR
ncbi:MAG: molecular chaperone DnaJ [Pseudomonadota bacterium]